MNKYQKVIKWYYATNGRKQVELSKLLGSSPCNIASIEKGNTIPKADLGLRILALAIPEILDNIDRVITNIERETLKLEVESDVLTKAAYNRALNYARSINWG
jgi:DNA-binding XRE family transcriptional regulator